MQASAKDHFGKFPMGSKVIVTMYGTSKLARVCYTSQRSAEYLPGGCTVIEYPNRVGDRVEVLNSNIELAE